LKERAAESAEDGATAEEVGASTAVGPISEATIAARESVVLRHEQLLEDADG
jgi:hypothetical protein